MTCIRPAHGPGRAGAQDSLSGQADEPNYFSIRIKLHFRIQHSFGKQRNSRFYSKELDSSFGWLGFFPPTNDCCKRSTLLSVTATHAFDAALRSATSTCCVWGTGNNLGWTVWHVILKAKVFLYCYTVWNKSNHVTTVLLYIVYRIVFATNSHK